MATIAGKVGVRGGFDTNPANNNAAVGAALLAGTMAIDGKGNIYFFDVDSYAVQKLTPDATETTYTISTVAGNGTKGFSGDGGPATQA